MTRAKDDDSGFKWGPFNLQGPKPWRLKIVPWQGSVVYPYSNPAFRAKVSHGPHQFDPTLPVIHKGNNMGDFCHPLTYPEHTEWYYWDNSLLPQFMNPCAANPSGAKVWTRLVYKGIFPGRYIGTEDLLEQREREINHLIRQLANGVAYRWQDIVRIDYIEYRPRARILLCLPSADIPWHYYKQPMNQIIDTIRQIADQKHWQLDIRYKPARRNRTGEASIDYQLEQGQYLAVIGMHSAIGAEVIARGVPYVALGQHALADLALTLEDLVQERIAPRDPDSVYQRLRQLLLATRSKPLELLSGTWSLDNYEKQFEPLTTWRIDL